jgi:hypothetical protein
VQAAGWLADFLGRQRLKVERAVGGVETAFRATIETGDGRTIPADSPRRACRESPRFCRRWPHLGQFRADRDLDRCAR